jgi:hypothetical protein
MLMGWNATFQKMLGINYIVISSYQTLEIKQEESFVVKIYNLKKKKNTKQREVAELSYQ